MKGSLRSPILPLRGQFRDGEALHGRARASEGAEAESGGGALLPCVDSEEREVRRRGIEKERYVPRLQSRDSMKRASAPGRRTRDFIPGGASAARVTTPLRTRFSILSSSGNSSRETGRISRDPRAPVGHVHRLSLAYLPDDLTELRLRFPCGVDLRHALAPRLIWCS
jgi:hypothetical protein